MGRKQEKLYRQWVKYSGLPSKRTRIADESKRFTRRTNDFGALSAEALESQTDSIEPDSVEATHPDISEEMPIRVNGRQSRLRMLYVLLAVLVVLLSGAVVLLIMQTF